MPAERTAGAADDCRRRARTPWSGTAEGSVNAQGAVVMRAPNGAHIDAQIDGHGTVAGRLTSGCSYQVIWQKKDK